MALLKKGLDGRIMVLIYSFLHFLIYNLKAAISVIMLKLNLVSTNILPFLTFNIRE